MASVTVIGRGAHVTGRVTGAVDLEIHGRLDGEVTIDGELTVEAEGLALANLSARRLIVRGAVKGDLSAAEAVVLENGARVVGDVRAPRIAIGRGALVRGYVQTDGTSATSTQRGRHEAREAAPRARAQTTAARPAGTPATKTTPKAPAPVARPAAVAARAQVPAPAPSSRTAPVSQNTLLAGSPPPKPAPLGGTSQVAPGRGPPAPVVPVLKKGSKGALKKKAG